MKYRVLFARGGFPARGAGDGVPAWVWDEVPTYKAPAWHSENAMQITQKQQVSVQFRFDYRRVSQFTICLHFILPKDLTKADAM